MRGIRAIKGMLSIDESCKASIALCTRDNMLAQGSLTGRLWTIDLSDTALRHTTNTQGQVKTDRTSGNDINLNFRRIAQFHNCALTETAFDLSKSQVNSFLAIAHACCCGGGAIAIYGRFFLFTHWHLSLQHRRQ